MVIDQMDKQNAVTKFFCECKQFTGEQGILFSFFFRCSPNKYIKKPYKMPPVSNIME